MGRRRSQNVVTTSHIGMRPFSSPAPILYFLLYRIAQTSRLMPNKTT